MCTSENEKVVVLVNAIDLATENVQDIIRLVKKGYVRHIHLIYSYKKKQQAIS